MYKRKNLVKVFFFKLYLLKNSVTEKTNYLFARLFVGYMIVKLKNFDSNVNNMGVADI